MSKVMKQNCKYFLYVYILVCILYTTMVLLYSPPAPFTCKNKIKTATKIRQ